MLINTQITLTLRTPSATTACEAAIANSRIYLNKALQASAGRVWPVPHDSAAGASPVPPRSSSLSDESSSRNSAASAFRVRLASQRSCFGPQPHPQCRAHASTVGECPSLHACPCARASRLVPRRTRHTSSHLARLRCVWEARKTYASSAGIPGRISILDPRHPRLPRRGNRCSSTGSRSDPRNDHQAARCPNLGSDYHAQPHRLVEPADEL